MPVAALPAVAQRPSKSRKRTRVRQAIAERAAAPGTILHFAGKKYMLPFGPADFKKSLMPELTRSLARIGGKIGRAALAKQAREFNLAVRVEPRRAAGLATGRRAARAGAPEAKLESALAEARARGAKRVAEIFGRPDMLSTKKFAELIHVTPEAVRQKREKHEILGLKAAKRDYLYPGWQLNGNGQLLPELPRLFEMLGGEPWAVYRFLLQRHPELEGDTALSALHKGNIQGVLAAAENASNAFS